MNANPGSINSREIFASLSHSEVLCNQIYPEKFIKLSAYEFNDELRPDNT